MLTKKVKMYGGYIDSLRTIHDCKEMAASFSLTFLCKYAI